MLINVPIHDLLNLELHNLNSEDKSSFKELRDFFMQAPVPLVILKGRDHFFTLSNLPYDTLIGRHAMGKNMLEVFTKDEIGHLLPILDGVYSTGIPFIGKDIPLNLANANGEIQYKWMDVTYHPFRENAEEEIKGIFAVFQDVTDRVIAKQVMAKSEEMFRELANTLPQMVWTATPEGTLDWFNDVWFEYTGCDRSTMGNEVWNQAIHPDELESVLKAWHESVSTGKLYRTEVRFKSALTGEYRWHLNQGGAIKNIAGQIEKWTGSCTDIHEQKIAFKMLETERDLRETMVAALSHDLRTPLAAAKISAQLLTRKVPDVVLLNRVAHRISSNMDRADKMIQNILDASLIKAGEKVSLDIQEWDLKELMQSTMDDLITFHGDRVSMINNKEITGYWDASAIKRVTENLVNNAIKYGQDKTPITVKIDKYDDKIEISVHNIGNTISETDQIKIFEPFQRSVSATRGPHKGWGIGLTLVKGLAEAHGGIATVKSSETEGTTFSLIIPQDSRNKAHGIL